MLDGPTLEICFQEIPVPALTKRPLHVDLKSADRIGETIRLVSLGATMIEEFETHTWMHDPEGNDFCLTDA